MGMAYRCGRQCNVDVYAPLSTHYPEFLHAFVPDCEHVALKQKKTFKYASERCARFSLSSVYRMP
jgi:hypothetical protein